MNSHKRREGLFFFREHVEGENRHPVKVWGMKRGGFPRAIVYRPFTIGTPLPPTHHGRDATGPREKEEHGLGLLLCHFQDCFRECFGESWILSLVCIMYRSFLLFDALERPCHPWIGFRVGCVGLVAKTGRDGEVDKA